MIKGVDHVYGIIGLLVGILVLAIGSSASAAGRISETQEFLIPHGVSSIDLTGYNGSITWVPVESGAQPRILAVKEVQGLFLGAMEEMLGNISVQDDSSGSEIVLEALQPRHLLGVTSQVAFTVYASPEQIKRFKGRTSNGAIRVKVEYNGLLDLKTSNGAITLDYGSGMVSLRTSNGAIDLGQVRLTDSSSVLTSNGRIEGAPIFPLHGEYLFETSNGRIELKMPFDTPGTFDVSTSNGKVDFCLGPESVSGQKSVSIRRGQGPSIKVRTSNGYIGISGF